MQLKTSVVKFSILVFFLFSINHTQGQSKDFEIEKVVFTMKGYEAQPDYDIIIYNDKTIIFNARSNNFKEKIKGDVVPFGTDNNGNNIRASEVRGIFKSKLKRKKFKIILDIIYSLKDEFAQRKFTSNNLHESEIILKVIISNNEAKFIHDIGMKGSKNLIELYKLIDDLRFSQNWK